MKISPRPSVVAIAIVLTSMLAPAASRAGSLKSHQGSAAAKSVPARFLPASYTEDDEESGAPQAAATPEAAAPPGGQVIVKEPADYAISPPMDALPQAAPGQLAPPELPDLPLPKHWNPSPVPDLSLDSTSFPDAMPGATVYGGQGNNCSCQPPDTNGDVGGNATYPYYVQTVNAELTVYNKTTGAALGGYPKQLDTFWATLGGNCSTTNNGDPIVLYDANADRWLVSQFSFPNGSGAGPYYQCIALSTSPNPTGTYYQWDYQWSATDMNDYPHFGVWPDGYYMTVHDFTSGATWNGQGVAAFERAAMIAGSSGARMVQFESLYNVNPPCSNNYGGMLASNWEGTTAPPSGAPNPFLEADAANELCSGDPSSIKIWNFHVDWSNTANSSFGNAPPGSAGPPNTVLAINNFTRLCAATGTCIPQRGTSQQLDSLGDRLMYRVDYRNFGSVDAIVFNHSADNGSGIGSIRWYEVQNPTAAPTLYQYSTYNPDTTHRWMGSVAMDASHDIAVGFSESVGPGNVYPSIFIAGRLVSDPLNTLGQGEASFFAGPNYQSGNRWGDYSSLSVDPSDQCTFWFTSEVATSGHNWQTKFGKFVFPSCSVCTPPGVPGSVTATASAPNQITVTWGAVGGATSYNVYRSSGACPGGTYTQIATGVTGTSYVDNAVTGGLTYSYEVTSVGSCESAKSTCSSATATGLCTSFPNQPTGLSATAASTGTCGVNLSWTAGSSNCGGSVTYSIYRSTSSGFTPSASNRIALGVSGTAYSDTGALSPSTPYYYIVHAVDTLTGAEETNTSQASATTSSSCALGSSNAQAFTVTSTGISTAGQNFLEWWNPASASATSWTVTINVRTDQYPVSPTDGLARTVASGRAISAAGSVDSLVDNNGGAGLVDGTTYYYALWVRN